MMKEERRLVWRAQGALASDYLQLRVADESKRLLDATAKAYAESLRITRNQYAVGTASEADVAQAETQLRSTEAQAIAVWVTRAQLEHAIAVLIGKPPADLSIAPTNVVTEVPVIPAGVPSALLERRPILLQPNGWWRQPMRRSGLPSPHFIRR
jgi:outer membrane protein TolC